MASSPDSRPDPDQLLAQLRGDGERARRGKLRIYFGASAGVGKTYAMLSAAQRERRAGRDVLVGVVETHGRSETAELMAGLDSLALRDVSYRGRTVWEFDLDAALARKPAVLLVDELAHSNADGSRHAKRWQDVQELLEAGIEVWTALNVQHLESLNGTVGAITGIRVNETVPDTVLDDADEVVLVDVTPDELLTRLKAGQVYLPQQAERAAQNFFRKGNLIALREIALRRTAEHVEDDVRSYRIEKSISPVWNTEAALLVCVGARAGAEQSVRTAARLAGQLNVRWHAAYVETPRLQRLKVAARDRVLNVLKLAEQLGAATAVLAGSDVAAALVAQAQRLNCATLVVGRPQLPAWASWTGGWLGLTMTRRLALLGPTLDIVEVGHADSARRLAQALPRAPDEAAPPAWPGRLALYAWALGCSVAVTLLALPLVRVFDLARARARQFAGKRRQIRRTAPARQCPRDAGHAGAVRARPWARPAGAALGARGRAVRQVHTRRGGVGHARRRPGSGDLQGRGRCARGQILARNAPAGGGAEFCVTLPRREPPRLESS